MNLELQPVVLKVFFDLFAIDIIHVQVCHCEDSSPGFVAFGQLAVLQVEDPVKESEVVRDFFIAIHVETILGFDDRSYKIRHVDFDNVVIFCSGIFRDNVERSIAPSVAGEEGTGNARTYGTRLR